METLPGKLRNRAIDVRTVDDDTLFTALQGVKCVCMCGSFVIDARIFLVQNGRFTATGLVKCYFRLHQGRRKNHFVVVIVSSDTDYKTASFSLTI